MQKIVPLSSYANSGKKQKRAYAFVKRSFDIVVSLVALLLLSPLFLVVSIIAAIDTKGKPLFIQQRMGKDNVPFMVFKFRTMNVAAPREVATHKLENPDQYISRVGETLRKLSIDELPQLINVLIGNMSIVGPRPERPEIAAQYEKEMPAFSLRLQVKAGLTGTAQVYGRYNTEPRDKLKMDLMYINRMSLAEDLKLIFATIKILLMKESTQGVEQGQTTAEKTEKVVEKSA